MASNVYTKSEILQKLASKGYFIDVYTLNTFFQKWKIESIFEDEQGSEFYDKNVLDTVLSKLFNTKNSQDTTPDEQVRQLRPTPPQVLQQLPPQLQPQMQPVMPSQVPQQQYIPPQYVYQQPYVNINPNIPPQYVYQQQTVNSDNVNPLIKSKKNIISDNQTSDILNNISLSDGTPLIDKIKDMPSFDEINNNSIKRNELEQYETQDIFKKPKEQKLGILEGAMQLAGQDDTLEKNQNIQDNEQNLDGEFDDISLLNESLEAQEKFKEYVISELQKKNADFNPNNIPPGEFKLDISERTIAMIARTMAKKIAKNINQIFANNVKNLPEMETIKEENKKLEEKVKELEEKNKQLRLLLSENKKYLNSFKPSIFFGLYKKVDPKEN